MPDFYYTIEKSAFAEFKDRGSSFLAFAFPVDTINDFKLKLKELKGQHPKANHHCFAYRLGTEGMEFRASDDGEPSGSAGKPILGQIDSKKLTNVAIVVVRYFGGTLLGVPGLINAYKTVSSLVLQLVPIIQKPVLINYILHFDYTLMNDIMIIIKRFGCVIIDNESQLFCKMKIGIPNQSLDQCLGNLKNLHTLEISN